MMNTFPPFVLFSAESDQLSEGYNRNRTALLAGALTHAGIDWERVDGVYEGRPEASFLVYTYEGSEIADRIEELARRYGQEAVLYVDAQRLAYLLMLNEQRTIEIGTWQEVPTDLPVTALRGHTTIRGKTYAAI